MLKLILISQFIFALGCLLMQPKKILNTFVDSERKQGILYAVYFSLSTIFVFNPMDEKRTSVTGFKRIFGEGVVNGYDCTRVSSNFTLWFLILALSFAVFSLFMHYIRTREYTLEQSKVWNFLDQFIVLAVVNIVLRGITYYQDALSEADSIFYYSFYLITFILIDSFAYVLLKMDRYIPAERFKVLMISLFCISYPTAILVSDDWNSGRTQMIIQVLLSVLAFFVVKCSSYKGKIKEVASNLFLSDIAVVIYCSIPFLTSFYIELVNIFNQHRIFIADPKKCYAILVMAFLIIGVMIGWCFKPKNALRINRLYPLLVMGVACLSIQVPLQKVYNADLFETANSSILISDFLNFGSIPIVEHYGGHMMTRVWEGVIYGIINQDYAGAALSPYAGYVLPVLAVLFYFAVKFVWNDDMALWVTLLFPFYNHWKYYGLGMLVCIAVVSYIKKHTYVRAMFIWLACVWCALYRLDLGYAFGIACVVTLIVYIAHCKDKLATKQLILTLMCTIIFFGGLWCILCVFKRINPIERLIEFIQIGLSNLNWGFNGIGDAGKTVYAWYYMFLPAVVEICLIYSIFSKKFKERTGEVRWIVMVLLGVSYFANFSRGLVRHSLMEMSQSCIAWSAYVFLAIFVGALKNKKELFLPAFTGFILIITLFAKEGNYTSISLLDTSSNGLTTFVDSWTDVDAESGKTYWETISDKREVVQRVVLNDSLQERIKPFEMVINELLNDDETYLDFMNRTFIYSAINRKDPVYVSQSPMQMSGEWVQEKFNESVEKDINRIPLAILPMSKNDYCSVELDGISNAYRYYKVSEFIYNHYEPLCNIGEFAIWCLPERHSEMKEKLLSSMLEDVSFIEWGYDAYTSGEENAVFANDSELHSYSLKNLPQIWAEMDELDAAGNEVIAELTERQGIFLYDASEPIDKSKGNYLLLSVNNQSDICKDSELIMGINTDDGFIEKYKYKFAILEGEHQYIFRISTDYFWYVENINAVNLRCDDSVELTNMKILMGD